MSRKNWQRKILLAGVVGFVAGVAGLVNAMAINQQQSSATSSTINFSCVVSQDGVPTTVAQTPRGKIALIRWVSDYFRSSGFKPTLRCEEVSKRFQNYYNQGILNYITTGIDNNQIVICVSTVRGGTCNGTLFTLRPEESASRVIQHLFDIAYRGLGPLEESSSSAKIYIDVKKWLETAPIQNQ